jgi:hypothetical protein
MRQYLSIHATSDSALVREDTFQGREYLVVPVVAIVEGVLQGANAVEPELATASEFGKNINGWNGRPVVMNHPQDGSGNYVSANSPQVLSDWGFGAIYDARVEDSKLKVEAWIDVERAKELGGEFHSTYERLVAGDLVEVSVGIFVEVVKRAGVYAGKKYGSVWSNVVPDHLAMLSANATGACSVEDGCGAPRVNGLKMANAMNIPVPPPPASAARAAVVNPTVAQEHTCTCQTPAANAGGAGHHTDHDESITTHPVPIFRTPTEEAMDALDDHGISAITGMMRGFGARMSINSLPADRFNTDIAKAICAAIRKKYGYQAYAYGYTTDFAVYEYYDYETGASCYKIGISVDENLVVTFTTEPTEVKVVMQIIDSPEEEDNMTVTTNAQPTAGEIAPVVTPSTTAEPTVATTTAPLLPTPASPIVPAPVLTVEQYIAQAPAGLREVLAESVRVHEARKDTIVQQLLSTNRCSFSADQLKAMSYETLQGLATLANVVQDYSGQGYPRAHQASPEAPGGNGRFTVHEAPKLWADPTPAA